MGRWIKERRQFNKNIKLLVEQYKIENGLCMTKTRKIWSLEFISDLLRKNMVVFGKMIFLLLSIVGMLSPFAFLQIYFSMRVLLAIILFSLISGVIHLVYDIYKYTNRIIRVNIKNMDFEIFEEDYIVNMITLLYKKAVSGKKQNLVFSMGMDETILRNPNDQNGKRIKYKSITEDFYQFMINYFGIDINFVIRNDIEKKGTGEYPVQGEVFTIKYKLGEVINKYKESPFAALEGIEFMVIHYVNSIYLEKIMKNYV